MNVMRGHPSDWTASPGRSAVTVGVFDGVHRGHRSLIRRLDPSHFRTVLTFEPHPVEVLRPGTHPRLLTTVDERIELLEEAGVDQVGVFDLAEIKEFEPTRFVEEVLVGKLSVSQIVCGLDFRFGKDRVGDVTMLSALGKEHGFVVDSAPLVLDEDENIVSSSRIRTHIESGRIAEAREAMDSPFRLTGQVIHGERRGTEIGVPTANIEPPHRKVVPATGIYAAYALLGEERHMAAVNIGVRPTFGEGHLLIEAHLLDFSGNIYGEEITIEPVSYLRPERAFDNVEELVAQMQVDIVETRRLLG